MFGRPDPIGETIKIDGLPFKVVGTMPKKLQTSMNNGPDDERAIIPYTTYQSIYGDKYVDEMIVKPIRVEDGIYVEKEIRRVLGKKYHFDPEDERPDPEGDNKIIAMENPNDPDTWKWTSADKLFLKLVDELHKRNIRVILDYSWNHTGVEFWAWKDILKNQEKSKYIDWYEIKRFDDPATEENEFDYHAWLGIRSLPEIKKVNLTTTRRIGQPYQGDINAGAKKHIYNVTQRWLEPDGDVNKGIDGYRLRCCRPYRFGILERLV